MSEISTVNGLSINAFQNAQLKKKYDKHINKIIEISQKKSNVRLISEEQKKISEILKKSKERSKQFKSKQFMNRCQAENLRLLKSLSTINTRQKAKTQREDIEAYPRQRMKTSCKEKIMREFEIQMENRKLAQSIMENVIDVHDYKKRMKKEISEYVKLKTQLQRLKPNNFQKIAPFHDVQSSIKLKLKTVHNQPGQEGMFGQKEQPRVMHSREKQQQ